MKLQTLAAIKARRRLFFYKPLTNQPPADFETILEQRKAFSSPAVAVIGGVLAVLATLAYSYKLANLTIPTPQAVSDIIPVAGAFFGTVLLSIAMILFDLGRVVKRRIADITGRGSAPLSPGWIVPYVLSIGRYRLAFIVSSLVYGLFYATITSMIVYQPAVDFAYAYGVQVPSLQVTPVQGSPLLTPVITVYLADHIGLLLVPLTTILSVTTSVLVGMNFALAWFAFESRARGVGRGWVAGMGAVVGLFTGCPTCAGLFFANFLGGAGAVSFSTLLGYYQPAFILLSIPVLLAAPYMTSRSLSKVFREGCVYLRKPA
jgi:hypothetical protein